MLRMGLWFSTMMTSLAAGAEIMFSAACAAAAWPGSRFWRSSTLVSCSGLSVLGITSTAPRARAWLSYISPSFEVYMMMGMAAVWGSFLMARRVWKPSMPGMVWSMKIMLGFL